VTASQPAARKNGVAASVPIPSGRHSRTFCRGSDSHENSQVVDRASFGPDALKATGQAFDQARWVMAMSLATP